MTDTTLLVADDHPLLRAAVVHALREAIPGLHVVEASSADTLE